uniref:DNA-directed RNA polymerase III subunit RPC3 n=1 Tax=Rostrostelium ellipticum TaxID=361140 RepID=A0A1L2FUP8_9MYCE|nr:RNA polymerase III subunit [Rostrostelium ellipticum]
MMYHLKLACDIVKESFGEDIEKVYRHLLYSGRSTIKSISSAIPDINSKRAKTCLMVLIQHNLVDYEELLLPKDKKDAKDKAKTTTTTTTTTNQQQQPTAIGPGGVPVTIDDIADVFYTANPANAIHRLRFSKYINFVKERIGDAAAIVVEELMDNGRLTMEAVVTQSASYALSRTEDVRSLANDATRQFEETFTQLVMEHFIMKAPNPRPVAASEEDVRAARDTSAPGGAGKAKLTRQQQQVLYDPFALPTSLLSQKQPAKADANLVSNLPLSLEAVENEPQPPAAPASKRASKKPAAASKKAAAKGKAAAAAAASSTPPAGSRKRKVVSFVEEDADELDNESLPDILMYSESAPVDISSGGAIQPTKKRALDRDVYNVVSTDEQNQTLASEEKKILWKINYDQFLIEFKLIRVIRHLSSLRTFCESITIHQRLIDPLITSLSRNTYPSCRPLVHPSSPKWRLTLVPLVQKVESTKSVILKQKMVESIIRQKYGDGGLRVFKLLTIKKMLEPKQVAEFAMLPMKDSKTLLFQLMERSIVRLQEVPRSSDHFAARTFYLFYVDYPHVAQQFIEDVLKAIYNTRERLRFELEPHTELMNKLETIPEDQLSEDQTKIIAKVRHISEILETTVINLDNDLLILSHF